jgi:hypothetical protein
VRNLVEDSAIWLVESAAAAIYARDRVTIVEVLDGLTEPTANHGPSAP